MEQTLDMLAVRRPMLDLVEVAQIGRRAGRFCFLGERVAGHSEAVYLSFLAAAFVAAALAHHAAAGRMTSAQFLRSVFQFTLRRRGYVLAAAFGHAFFPPGCDLRKVRA